MSNDPLQPPPAFQTTATPKPRKSRKLLWILLLIPASVIGLLAMIIGAGALFFYSGQEKPVTDKDRDVILDINILAEWVDDYSPDKQGEIITKTRYIDGSYDVDYEYDIPDDPDAPYLNCSVTVARKVADARNSYLALWGGTRLGMSVLSDVEIEVVERNDLFKWGDESRFAILKTDGQPFGNVFITRNGKHVFHLLISGVYFDDHESISDLLSEPLSRLSSYSP